MTSEFVITRVFDAPRELVFKAWTEADRLAQWWGPTGSTIRVDKLDLRPGGVFHYAMRFADGRDMWGKFVYREIVVPERLVFVNSFSDAEGNTAPAPFSGEWPIEILNTWTFSEQEGKTTVTGRAVPLSATDAEVKFFASMHKSLQQGYTGTLDQLADYLAKRTTAA